MYSDWAWKTPIEYTKCMNSEVPIKYCFGPMWYVRNGGWMEKTIELIKQGNKLK